MRVPIIITILLIILGVGVTMVIQTKFRNLTGNDKIRHWLSLWALMVASVSAVFVISSYQQTNKAFILSQKPSLLIQMRNGADIGLHEDLTQIYYENTSDAAFEDLNIKLTIITSTTTIDFSDLFSNNNMYMASKGYRELLFKTKEEFLKEGINLDEVDGVILNVGYEFHFLGKLIPIDAQEYKWKKEENRWNIL